MSYFKMITKIFLKVILTFMLICTSISVFARHKCISTTGIIINGKLQEDDSRFFGSCINCKEVICDMVNTITKQEDKFCTETDCFFPGKTLTDYDLIIEDQFNWDKNKNLVIHTRGSIIFEGEGKIISEKDGSIILKAGVVSGKQEEYKGMVKFMGNSIPIEIQGNGKVKIYSSSQLKLTQDNLEL